MARHKLSYHTVWKTLGFMVRYTQPLRVKSQDVAPIGYNEGSFEVNIICNHDSPIIFFDRNIRAKSF